jgi:galactokinase
MVIDKFKSFFDEEPLIVVRAPGRINLLGEHTDYNNGFVLPAGIDKSIYFGFSKRTDSKLLLFSVDFNQEKIFEDINNLEIIGGHWADHISGVLKEIEKRNINFSCGLNIAFGGNIPVGSGLSSSAALESGVGFGVSHLFDLNLTKLEIAKIAQDTEHNHIGVKCGIMDMYASLFSKSDSVIKLDCRSLEHTYAQAIFEGYKFVLVNSGVKHKLAESEYNIRRNQCQTGVDFFNHIDPKITSLRDLDIDMINEHKHNLDSVIYNRCKYVVEENLRVVKAVSLLEANDFSGFGHLMNKTHEGLKNEYEVSCKELDFLQSTALEIDGVLGSRMMGGGFGGCTLNFIKSDSEEDFIFSISSKYEAKYGFKPEIYSVKICNGVEILP